MKNTKINNWIVTITNLYKDILWLNKNNKIFIGLAEQFNNDKINSELFNFIKVIYSSDMSMRIRRIIDEGKRSESLYSLITEILFNYQLINSEWFLKKYPSGENESLFKNFFNNRELNTSLLIDDLNLLKTESEKIRIFTDKIVAHKDKNKPKNIPNFNELHALVKIATSIFDKYYYLLKQSHSGIQEINKKSFKNTSSNFS